MPAMLEHEEKEIWVNVHFLRQKAPLPRLDPDSPRAGRYDRAAVSRGGYSGMS